VAHLLLAALLALGAAGDVPALTGPVVDQAGLLSPTERQRLEELCRAANQGRGGETVQLQYLVVSSLAGEPIETYSMRVAERWQLGTKAKDNGVLVVVARQDRKVRIEVGGGLEGQLTDIQSARIIRNVIAPAFQSGRYGAGLYDAGVQILAATGALPQDTAPRPAASEDQGIQISPLLIIAIIVGFLVLRGLLFGFSSRRRGGFWGGGGPFIGGGGFGGGGFGGGGSSGGSGGGGGGGFSGGGASGSW
jgi:uncharacterized protein